jgi:hypothetical protein
MSMTRISTGLLIGGLLVLGGSPALALHAEYSPDGGAYVHSSSSGGTIYVTDQKGDDHSVYGEWNSSSNRLDNHNGVGTTVSKGGLSITSDRACTNIPVAHDPCSSWG